MLIKKITAKRILNRSGIASCAYALNPYTGCSNNCTYCYASFLLRFIETKHCWGDFVFIKQNAPLLVKKELKRIGRGRVCIGTVCDPYLDIEAKYSITRKVLEELSLVKNPISIQTKNKLIIRDLDILKRINRLDITITITSVDEEISKILEPNANSIKDRLAAIKKLVGEGLSVNIFVGPLLPGLSDDKSSVDKLYKTFKNHNVNSVFFDSLNPYPQVQKRMLEKYKAHFPSQLNSLKNAIKNRKQYQQQLRIKIQDIVTDGAINIQILF